MQTDIAANSDSTLMYSHGASAPVFTSEDSPSTMCVCGEIGYAPITSGRHRATVSATAREPSICLSTCQLLDSREGRLRGGDVALPDRAVEALAERGRHGIQRDRPRDRGERGEHRRTRHRPPEMLAGDLARRQRDQMSVRHLDVGARAVEEDGAVLEAGEHAGDVQERGVLDHEHVRVHDRLVRADGRVTDRRNAITGAPVRSDPKLGNACAWRPSRNAATDSSSAAVTTPWPPRPWKRTWNTLTLSALLHRTPSAPRRHDAP